MTYIGLLVGLFIILSPGLLLTIPPLSLTELENKSIGSGTASNFAICEDTTTAENCKKAASLFASGYTSVPAVLVHGLVFALALYFLPQYIGLRKFGSQGILVLSVLFVALSPGFLLTLPALSKTACGITGKHVGETTGPQATEYCDAITTITKANNPKCHKCTSVWMSGFTDVVPVLVHAVVFAAATYAAANVL